MEGEHLSNLSILKGKVLGTSNYYWCRHPCMIESIKKSYYGRQE